jgi:hypothetical protein
MSLPLAIAPQQYKEEQSLSYSLLYPLCMHMYPLFHYLYLNNINKTTAKIFSLYHSTPWANDKDVIEWFFYTEKKVIKDFLLGIYRQLLSDYSIDNLITFVKTGTIPFANIYSTDKYNCPGFYLTFNKEEQNFFNTMSLSLIECFKQKLQHQSYAYETFPFIQSFIGRMKVNLKTICTIYKSHEHQQDHKNQAIVHTYLNSSPTIDLSLISKNILPIFTQLKYDFYQNIDQYTQEEQLFLLQLIASFYELIIYTLPIAHSILYTSHEYRKDKSFLRAGVDLPLENILGIPLYIFSDINLQEVESGQIANFDYYHFTGYLHAKRHIYSFCPSIKIA